MEICARTARLPRPMVLAAATLLVMAVGGVTVAEAATPGAGTVSSTTPTVTWTGGPFAVPNTTATIGALACNAAAPCDDYALTVDVPAGYDTANDLKIKVSWANSAADFDVYLYDGSGAEVGQAASTADPETLVVPPRAGQYTVRIVPFAPLGESYSATAELAAKPAAPAPGPVGAASFTNYPAPGTLPRAHDAGEPSIGVNWKTGKVMYQAYTDTYRVSFDDTKSPATAAWEDKSAHLPKCTANASLDPILFTDHDTGRTFESQLAGKTSLMCYTDDDGETWTPSQGGGINSGVDHQTVGGGRWSPNGVGGTPLYPNAVYYCSQDIADALCATSRDGGLTFGPAVPMYTLLDCGGLHGHVKVSPKDGTVYVPNKGCGGNQAVAVSEDNGLTWQVRKVPTSLPADSDPSVGIGSDGTVYFGYQNADGHAHVAVSNDKGRTWESDQDVGAALGVQNVVFPAVVAGDAERAAFAFLGTANGGNYQDATNFTGEWHLYVTVTYDGGRTWSLTDATPNDAVQKGSICTGGTTCGTDRNLLDFMDIQVDKQGRVLVGYADGCTGACATGGAQNFDALATIARQSGGKSLFAAFDPVKTAKGKNK
ncbi:sialidase family protein [Micromonospora chersina]|uniref:sialidase family protein n=1 Tax=Micromonospora chersina TaxID=47854 RepID=UPI0033F7CC4F